MYKYTNISLYTLEFYVQKNNLDKKNQRKTIPVQIEI